MALRVRTAWLGAVTCGVVFLVGIWREGMDLICSSYPLYKVSPMPSMFEVGAVCSLPAVGSLWLASLVCSVNTICFELWLPF